MKSALLGFLLAVSALAQTSPFPASLDSNATLGVPADGVSAALTAQMLIGDTTAQVANAVNIPQWSLITFGTELAKVCLVTGNTLTFGTSTACPSIAGRGLSGTTVAAHSLGTIGNLSVNAWYHRALASAVEAAERAIFAGPLNTQWVADPTGVVPASAALQALIVEAQATGNPVICTGTYNLGSTGLVAAGGNLTFTAGPGGCILNYSGSGWPLTLGTLSANTYNYAIAGININSVTGTGHGIQQLATVNVMLTDIHVEGAFTSGICHLIDGGALQSIFTRTVNLWCNHTLIGQQQQSTGGFNNVTTVANYSFHAFNSYPTPASGSTGVLIQSGGGDGVTFYGGDIESEALGIDLVGTFSSGQGIHRVSFMNVRFESNVVDALLDTGAFNNNFIACIGLQNVTNNSINGVNSNQFVGNPLIPNVLIGPLAIGGTLSIVPGSTAPISITGIANDSTTPIFDTALVSGGVHPFTVGHTGCITNMGEIATLICVGSSNPNGSVTAPQGALYLSGSGGAGTTLWIKESGSGNTGWVGK